MDGNARIARELVRIAKSLVAARALDGCGEEYFIKEMEKAIEAGEQVSFLYMGMTGEMQAVTATPVKMEKDGADTIVTAVDSAGNEEEYYVSDMGVDEDTVGFYPCDADTQGFTLMVDEGGRYAKDNGEWVRLHSLRYSITGWSRDERGRHFETDDDPAVYVESVQGGRVYRMPIEKARSLGLYDRFIEGWADDCIAKNSSGIKYDVESAASYMDAMNEPWDDPEFRSQHGGR